MTGVDMTFMLISPNDNISMMQLSCLGLIVCFFCVKTKSVFVRMYYLLCASFKLNVAGIVHV